MGNVRHCPLLSLSLSLTMYPSLCRKQQSSLKCSYKAEREGNRRMGMSVRGQALGLDIEKSEENASGKQLWRRLWEKRSSMRSGTATLTLNGNEKLQFDHPCSHIHARIHTQTHIRYTRIEHTHTQRAHACMGTHTYTHHITNARSPHIECASKPPRHMQQNTQYC